MTNKFKKQTNTNKYNYKSKADGGLTNSNYQNPFVQNLPYLFGSLYAEQQSDKSPLTKGVNDIMHALNYLSTSKLDHDQLVNKQQLSAQNLAGQYQPNIYQGMYKRGGKVKPKQTIPDSPIPTDYNEFLEYIGNPEMIYEQGVRSHYIPETNSIVWDGVNTIPGEHAHAVQNARGMFPMKGPYAKWLYGTKGESLKDGIVGNFNINPKHRDGGNINGSPDIFTLAGLQDPFSSLNTGQSEEDTNPNQDPNAEDPNIIDPNAKPGDENPLNTIQYMAQRLMQEGYEPHHIAGVLGNLEIESGGFNAAAYNPDDKGSPSGGLAQFKGTRLDQLKVFANKNDTDWTNPYLQTEYIINELNTTEQKAKQKLLETKNSDEAAAAFDEYYERSDGKARDQRIQAAKKYNDFFQGVQTNTLPNFKTKSNNVNVKHLDPKLTTFMNTLVEQIPGLVVTSGNDSKHKKGSKHGQNKAVDIGANSSNKQAYAQLAQLFDNKEIAEQFKQQYGIEDIIKEKDHYHIEMLKNGGLMNYKRGGINNPIYTSDFNDSKLQSYNDSLNIYNIGENVYKQTQKNSQVLDGYEYLNIDLSSEKSIPYNNFTNEYENGIKKFKVYNSGTKQYMEPTSINRFKGQGLLGFLDYANQARYAEPKQPYIYGEKPKASSSATLGTNKINTIKSKSTHLQQNMNRINPQQYNPLPEWEQRLYNGSKERIDNGDGSYSSHKMMSWESDGRYFAAPTIVKIDGKLKELSADEAIKYHFKNRTAKQFNTDEEAQHYANNGYKQLANVEKPILSMPEMRFPQQKGIPIYGPGNTIIGYSNNMNFSPAYEYTGAANNSFNLQDKALLNNPEALKAYLSKKDNYKFKEELKNGGKMKNKYTYKNGGMTQSIFENNISNAEIEGKENVYLPNGVNFKAIGDSHVEGGIDVKLPQGTFIFSENLKAPKEVTAEMLHKEVKDLTKAEKKFSFSDLANKYNTEKEFKFANKDRFAKSASKLNLEHKTTMLDTLKIQQEMFKAKKGIANDLEGVMPKMGKGGKFGYAPKEYDPLTDPFEQDYMPINDSVGDIYSESNIRQTWRQLQDQYKNAKSESERNAFRQMAWNFKKDVSADLEKEPYYADHNTDLRKLNQLQTQAASYQPQQQAQTQQFPPINSGITSTSLDRNQSKYFPNTTPGIGVLQNPNQNKIYQTQDFTPGVNDPLTMNLMNPMQTSNKTTDNSEAPWNTLYMSKLHNANAANLGMSLLSKLPKVNYPVMNPQMQAPNYMRGLDLPSINNSNIDKQVGLGISQISNSNLGEVEKRALINDLIAKATSQANNVDVTKGVTDLNNQNIQISNAFTANSYANNNNMLDRYRQQQNAIGAGKQQVSNSMLQDIMNFNVNKAQEDMSTPLAIAQSGMDTYVDEKGNIKYRPNRSNAMLTEALMKQMAMMYNYGIIPTKK